MRLHVAGWLSVILFSLGFTCHAQTLNSPVLARQDLGCEKKKVSPCGTRTLFLPRSQGTNWARRSVGYHEYIPACDGQPWGHFSFAIEYSHSMKGERLAQYLFGSNQLHFSGSQIPNRGPDDLLADNFGLATTFQGSVAFDPRIDSIVLEGSYYLGLDLWHPGLFFLANFPLVITRWDLGLRCKESNNITSQDAPVFPEGYMSLTTTNTAASIREALAGDFVFGDMKQPLTYGAFPCGRMHKVAVAQIDCSLGYTFFADECSHLAALLTAVLPTGTIPSAEFVFEPIVGNGRLWEFGPGISTHCDLITVGDHHVAFHLNGVFTYQFKRFQIRSFDFIGKGALSRYMLLKEFNEANEYAGSLINGIDFSTRRVRVGGSAKIDVAAMISYYSCCWGVDIGYNIYARTKEKLRLQNDLFPAEFNRRLFGIKGTEGVYYRLLDTSTGEVTIMPTSTLNSVQNKATIQDGSSVTNGQFIQTGIPNQVAIAWDSPLTGMLIFAQTSEPPIVLTADSLDILSGSLPHQLTHKFFIHLNHTFDYSYWEPQIGIGGEIEFDGRSNILSSLNQWGFWCKCSVAF